MIGRRRRDSLGVLADRSWIAARVSSQRPVNSIAMSSDVQVEIRPRTTGEVLDDAIRLSLAEAPVLLALSGLFLVPAFVAVLLLLALPESGQAWRVLGLSALAAFLILLTGI